ncbi:DMT family transporter [Microbulbifer celer]|uniref:DMT family transporter n=1 Tax=Microbulbifer celer TaxID=435905 RepID=A0ABW3U4Y7_9GAMM|nr:DMT family transporter [Microbulbifer celer]UFN56668.1 DMT family transporter [Microbulbifer celer]
MLTWATLALIAGAAIALQASINAQLGVQLRSALLGTAVAFAVSWAVSALAIVVSVRQYPNLATIQAVPWYLWLGGLFSAFGVGLFYFLIPRMGVGSMMSFALSGQILVAVICSHFGWFDLPVKPISVVRGLGIAALLAGIALINWE